MKSSLQIAPLDERQRYTVDEATAYLRQSRAKTFLDIRAGLLPVIKDGRRTYIPGSAIAQRSRLDSSAA
jgi:hypothetical protein